MPGIGLTFIQRSTQREFEAGAIRQGDVGPRKNLAQPLDQRIVQILIGPKSRVTRQRACRLRVQSEETLVDPRRHLPPAIVFVKIGKVEQRRNIVGIVGKSGF